MTNRQWYAKKIDLLTSAAERAPLGVAIIWDEKAKRLTRQAMLLTQKKLEEEV